MIYPPAPDIWLFEVLFRQSQAASALREEASVGTWSWRDQGQPSHSPTWSRLDAVVGCRAFPRRFGAPSRCLSAMPADQRLWINRASKGRPV